ncbi:MAG: hypothetical protein H6573_19450 [Lewinellaceae bacterium]|nr:hypothetical protein [Phaeodactylibacter sp.]MCB0615850.1 hypothetical protein [Phaeodactylibacter sp.]MCB9349665.1 hypothetical protein [Lewinellaceae bacterium]
MDEIQASTEHEHIRDMLVLADHLRIPDTAEHPIFQKAVRYRKGTLGSIARSVIISELKPKQEK